MNHIEVGKRGEELAKKYIRGKGYKIIEQNWHTKYGEIDLVAENKEWCVLIEVRTKIGEQFGLPEETLNYRKMQRLMRNANAYAAIRRISKPYRIDAVCIVLDESGNLIRIDHYENITG
ncbi:MAG: YraN family protein [Candidatus Wildermuthbacteria bacterium]|nr:YraN family protein [Candidatus Wildermuthbacteria bacterium]